MQRMSVHNNAPLKVRKLHHLSLSHWKWGEVRLWEWRLLRSRDALVGALWRGAFRGLFALCFSTPLKHCWKLWGVERAGANCLLGGFWAGCRYRGAPIHSHPTKHPGTRQVRRYSAGSDTRYEGTRQGQVPGSKVLSGGKLFAWWLLVPAGVHDRIPSDSCKSRFNITALKRPTSVQQCPWSYKIHSIVSLACLGPTSDQPILLVHRYPDTQLPRYLGTHLLNTQVPLVLLSKGKHAPVSSLAWVPHRRIAWAPHRRIAQKTIFLRGQYAGEANSERPICSGMQLRSRSDLERKRCSHVSSDSPRHATQTHKVCVFVPPRELNGIRSNPPSRRLSCSTLRECAG